MAFLGMNRGAVLLVLAASLLGTLALAPSASAAIAAPGTTLYGYETSGEEALGSGRILSYDIGADSLGPAHTCTPSPTDNGRAISYDPIDGNLWYAYLNQLGGEGIGLILKETPPSDTDTCQTVGYIPFGDGPGGTIQDDVGAIDVDPDDGNLWVAGFYTDTDSKAHFYKVDRSTGAILQECKFTSSSGTPAGNDTLTVAKLTGLSGSGKYLLTDAGDLLSGSNSLYAIDTAACTGGADVTPVTTYTPTVAMGFSGADYEQDQLIFTNTQAIFSLGGPPFDTLGSSTVPTTTELEGISVTSPAVIGTKYDDVNGNGTRDSGEPALPGFKMYVDYNDNGQLDAGEPSGTSHADGSYWILDIKLGSFKVREVPQTGYTCKQPATCSYSETFAPADRKTGRDFGNKGPVPPVPPVPGAFDITLTTPNTITLSQFLNGFYVTSNCVNVTACQRFFQELGQTNKGQLHLAAFNLTLARAFADFGQKGRVKFKPCNFRGAEHKRCKHGLKRNARRDKPFKIKVTVGGVDHSGHHKYKKKTIKVK
ncbi:MAG: large repetitive protein [Thermoleophilaceae bacterium]|nr:large repetitive protein [Thermoleophilaceae bacterium]